jgi:hypothetical protein
VAFDLVRHDCGIFENTHSTAETDDKVWRLFDIRPE